MKRTKDYRLHQENKKKNKAVIILKHDNIWNPSDEEYIKKIGIRSHTPKWCSCHMCGNPRKYWKEKTIQERRAEQNDG
tara:strand:+ start:115 stop:348 length:234 start_codon:yes stop_codon:yes gene_type:complete